MLVRPGLLHSGGTESHRAGDHAEESTHLARTSFTDMDVRNAATMRAVRCGSDT
jgi:Protein of unknown function (DUF2563)